MIAKKLLTTIAIAIIVLFSGCANDDFVGVNGLCPVVESTVPADGTINVPLNQVISATFNEKMNPTTISQTSFTVAANGDLTIKPSGSAIFDSNLTINGNSTLGDASGDVTTINGTAVTIPNGLNFDSNTLVIDHTNNRIGIGAPTPSTTLEVAGDVKISGVTPFITIGDGDAEDCGILLNCTGSGVSGIDYYVAIDLVTIVTMVLL